MKRIAVYAGSFDPLTNGHLWMIRQGARMFDELIVAMGDNPDKRYTFSHEERMDMLRVALSDMPDVRIAEFHNRFLVDSPMNTGLRSCCAASVPRRITSMNA